MRTIGIYGGSFNPVHNGHMEIAREAIKHTDILYMVPTAGNPLKKGMFYASEFDRKMMIERAIEDYKFSNRVTAVGLENTVYMIDTFRELNKKLGNDVKLKYILGADAAASIDLWKGAVDLHKFAKFVVFARADFKDDWKMPLERNHIEYEEAFVDMPHISSTMIRDMVINGEDVSKYVPESIVGMVEKLYGRK